MLGHQNNLAHKELKILPVYSTTVGLQDQRGRTSPGASPLWNDSRSESQPALMSSSPGNLEKRYLINFRQVGVIVLQSRRVNGQVFELLVVGCSGLDFYAKHADHKGAVIFRCFLINITPLTTFAQSNNYYSLCYLTL